MSVEHSNYITIPSDCFQAKQCAHVVDKQRFFAGKQDTKTALNIQAFVPSSKPLGTQNS